MSAGQGADYRAARPAGAPGGSAATTAGPAFSFDYKRLTRNDLIVGGATLVLFISLFMPWFTASAGSFASGSVNGLWHGYMYISLILALAILAYLVLRAGFDVLPFRLPVGSEQLLLAATGLNFLLALISFVFKPSGDGIVTVGWGVGAFLGLIAAIVAVAPLSMPFLRSRVSR